MKKNLFISSLILLCTGANLTAQNPYIQHYTTSDGLPSNFVYQVYQDSRKFIWFATDAGVARYDGSTFNYYRKPDGLSSNDVIRIKEDSSGRMWFLHLNATLNYLHQHVMYNAKTAPFLDSLVTREFFRDFYEDEHRTIYFYNNYQRDIFSIDTQNKVKRTNLASQLKKVVPGKYPIDGMVIRHISQDTAGEFILWTGIGLFRLKSLSEEPVYFTEAFRPVRVFPAPNNHKYLVQTPSGKHKAEIRKIGEDIPMDSIPPMLVAESEFISSILEDINGYIWISTFDKGVYCYKGDKIIRHYDIKEAQAVIQDHENNIWISSLKDGVYKLSPFTYHDVQYQNDNFQNSGILALSHHYGEGIWFTNGRTVYLLQDDKLLTLDYQLEAGSLNQLLHVRKDALLIGEISTRQISLEGIDEDPSSLKVHFHNADISFRAFKNITLNITRDEISTFDLFKLFILQPENLFRDIKSIDLGERIYYTYYNCNNELVVNARSNYLFRNDSLLIYNPLSLLDNKIITDHLILNESTDLINVEGDSLFLLNQGRLYNLTSAFDHPVDLQIKFMECHDTTLIISTARNIFICDNPLNILVDKPVRLRPIDISFRSIHDILFEEDLLYVASDDGLNIFPINTISEITTNPPIPYFQSVQANDRDHGENAQEIFLTGRNRIHFVFGSINYSSSPVKYSYKLAGIDDEWIQGTGTNVVYENLPRGKYLFNLKVRKSTSDWSEPIIIPVTIGATIWQHPLFYVILSFITIALVFLTVLWRKNAEMKRREVEHQLVLLEQKALQSMMNPHFIFNTLGSIQYYLLKNKSREAGLSLSQFAGLIRQNLSSINSAVISLEEEIDRLKNYLELEKLRMENKFEYQITLDRSVISENTMIPSMIIQPFVENSIWHGLAHLNGPGRIDIKFTLNNEKSLKVMVEDNGIGFSNIDKYGEKGSNHLRLGMEITRKRLDLLGKKHNVETGITFTEQTPGRPNPGTRVLLIVPFSLGEEAGE